MSWSAMEMLGQAIEEIEAGLRARDARIEELTDENNRLRKGLQRIATEVEEILQILKEAGISCA